MSSAEVFGITPDSFPEAATSFRTRDGLQLHLRQHLPEGKPRGTILWVHGGCEHGGRYSHVTSILAAAGWMVLLPDHRGHGLSEGTRTDVDRYEIYLDDLMAIQEACIPGGRADVVLGHSFGGLLAIRLAQTRMKPRALVLTAPLLRLKLPVPRWKWALGRLLILLAPMTRFRTQIDPRNMTRDPEFLARRKTDPLLIRSVTARWFFEMQRAVKDAWRERQELTGSILAFQGLLDRTVDPEALPDFLQSSAVDDRELHLLPEHVHEILQESDWRQSAQIIVNWLNARFPQDKDFSKSAC